MVSLIFVFLSASCAKGKHKMHMMISHQGAMSGCCTTHLDIYRQTKGNLKEIMFKLNSWSVKPGSKYLVVLLSYIV